MSAFGLKRVVSKRLVFFTKFHVKPLLTWKEIEDSSYTSGWDGYLGGARVFRIWWNSMIPRDEPKKYQLNSRLPGFKENFGLYLNRDEAMEKAETVLIKWLDFIGVEVE